MSAEQVDAGVRAKASKMPQVEVKRQQSAAEAIRHQPSSCLKLVGTAVLEEKGGQRM